MVEPITLVDCPCYVEDPCIADDCGEPKGQCANCGAKWFEHHLSSIIDEIDRESAKYLQTERGLNFPTPPKRKFPVTYIRRSSPHRTIPAASIDPKWQQVLSHAKNQRAAMKIKEAILEGLNPTSISESEWTRRRGVGKISLPHILSLIRKFQKL